MALIDKLKFDPNGLIPAIVQDYRTGKVLMLGYMKKEGVEETFAFAARFSGAAAGKPDGSRGRPPATLSKSRRSCTTVMGIPCSSKSSRKAPCATQTTHRVSIGRSCRTVRRRSSRRSLMVRSALRPPLACRNHAAHAAGRQPRFSPCEALFRLEERR